MSFDPFSVLLQSAPFVAIIIMEVTGLDFRERWKRVYSESQSEILTDDTGAEPEFKTIALFTFDFENATQHLELTIISLVIIFITTTATAPSDRTLVGAVFLVAVLVVFVVRNLVLAYFERREPSRYVVKDQWRGIRYGTLAVVVSNLLAIGVIVALELLR